MGGLFQVRQHLRLEPGGPGAAPAEGLPPGLLGDHVHDQGEAAGEAGPPPEPPRPRGAEAPVSYTHLTLTTNKEVEILVDAVALNKKK